MSRRKSDLSRALPQTKPVPQPTRKVDPLRESSAQVWRRWSQDAADRERRERLARQAEDEAMTERAIYPLEHARTVAETHAPACCPEWRYLKPEIAKHFGVILKQQPEMRQRDVRARESIIVALFNALPAHMHGALSELRELIELVSIARESSAFLIGYECGRTAGRRTTLQDPRVMLTPDPARRQLPAADTGLRLHDGLQRGGDDG